MKHIKFWLVPMLYVVLLVGVLPTAFAEQLYIVHFETGPSWQKDVPPGQQVGFSDHAGNLQQLRKKGVIRFGARYKHLGMIVVAAESLDVATRLMEADPGVQSGLFVFNIAQMNVFYPWQDMSKQ